MTGFSVNRLREMADAWLARQRFPRVGPWVTVGMTDMDVCAVDDGRLATLDYINGLVVIYVVDQRTPAAMFGRLDAQQ
jgi:hypothetical protein